MGSILDIKRFSDFGGKKRPRREKRYRRNRKHYVTPIDMLSPRRRFVKSRLQAVIVLFIILAIGIVAIISYFNDNPSEQTTLSGTYKGTVGSADNQSPITMIFEGNTVTSYIGEGNTSPRVAEYYLTTGYVGDNAIPAIVLTDTDTNETFSVGIRRSGDCIAFAGVDACKVASVNGHLYLYIGICLAVIGGIIILFLIFRPRIFGRRQRPVGFPKVRVSIPSNIRQQVYARSRGRCERPRCSYGGKVHIHHIDENPSNNSLDNLIAVCPNCHSRIHDGAFSVDAQRSWITE
jgi:hypothetical protein